MLAYLFGLFDPPPFESRSSCIVTRILHFLKEINIFETFLSEFFFSPDSIHLNIATISKTPKVMRIEYINFGHSLSF